jgi:hypothetical protein
LLGDKSTKALTINIIGDAYIPDQTHIKVEKAAGGKSTAWRAEHIIAILERCAELGLEDRKEEIYPADIPRELTDNAVRRRHQGNLQLDHAISLTPPKVNTKIHRQSFALNSRPFRNQTVPKNSQN